MNGRLRDLTVNRDGTQNVTVTVTADFTKDYDKLKDQDLTIEIKKASKGRSMTANAFCWSLCSDIGRAMNLSKEEVYRMAIKAVGVHTNVAVPAWQIPTLRQRWEEHGTGWFLEILDDFSIGSKWVCLYYGSSTYTVDEMRVLIDWLVDQAEQMQISIPLSKKEEEELLERWGKR